MGDVFNIGDDVLWRPTGFWKWIRGTVRGISSHRGRDEIRCDDGDRDNPDLMTNGFTVAEWVPASRVAAREAPRG